MHMSTLIVCFRSCPRADICRQNPLIRASHQQGRGEVCVCEEKLKGSAENEKQNVYLSCTSTVFSLVWYQSDVIPDPCCDWTALIL